MVVGSVADDSARLGALLGACWGNGTLLRSAAALSSIRDSAGLHVAPVDPRLETVWNSEIPVSANDGSLWAGRGLNATFSGGVVGSYGRFRFMLAPRLNVSQNKPFAILPSGRADRSGFASPWRSGVRSADLPLRFGSQRYVTVDPGETLLEYSLGPVALGATSAAAWWGPGVRNALLMSNNAGGIPQVYLRSGRPLSTRLGEIEGVWLLGQLTESPFFDREPGNDTRSLSAAALTLRVAADTGLRVGISRAVYDVARFRGLAAHVADVLLAWPRQSPFDSTGSADQITSLFAKWTIPSAGLAAHVEWARVTGLRSLRDLLVKPQEGQGYTVGIEWAKPISPSTTVRIESEFTSLEQTPLSSGSETTGFYTSASIPQGYTLRGQSIGASIGPGSSSQYLGATVFRGQRIFGASLGRIRWEEDSYYRPPSQGGVSSNKGHDVSLFAGLSAAADWRWGQVEIAATRTLRMNYLFQTGEPFLFRGDFDLWNNTLSLRATPHLFPATRK